METPPQGASYRPMQPTPVMPVDHEQATAGRLLRSYGYQIFAVLLGIALAFM